MKYSKLVEAQLFELVEAQQMAGDGVICLQKKKEELRIIKENMIKKEK